MKDAFRMSSQVTASMMRILQQFERSALCRVSFLRTYSHAVVLELKQVSRGKTIIPSPVPKARI